MGGRLAAAAELAIHVEGRCRRCRYMFAENCSLHLQKKGEPVVWYYLHVYSGGSKTVKRGGWIVGLGIGTQRGSKA